MVWGIRCWGFSGKPAKYIRAIDAHLNSECIAKQLRQADVYDIAHVILNRNRILGSRGKGNDNDREGKDARWEGKQREANLANGGDQPEEGDNYQLREEFGSWGEIIIKISGGSDRGCSIYGGDVESSSDLDWGEFGDLWGR